MLNWLLGGKKDKGARTPEPARTGGSIEAALGHHRAGRLPEAEAEYRGVLAREPNNVDALHFLGVIAFQRGDNASAEDLISRALSVADANAPAHNNLGNVLEALGRQEEAAACFRKALALAPDYLDALLNLGRVLWARGERDEALAFYRKAVALVPQDAFAQSHVGNVLQDRGHLDLAAACYGKALALKPDFFEAHLNLGRILISECRFDEAASSFRSAVAVKPDLPEAHRYLGLALFGQNRFDEAAECYGKALALRPEFTEVYKDLGSLFAARGRFPEADEHFLHALRIQPTHAPTKFTFALAKLLQGDYRAGLDLFESRFEALTGPAYAGMHARLARVQGIPRWSGEGGAGRSLLVWTDQGLGDALMVMRYLPRLKARGFRRVTVHCERALARIMKSVAGVDEVETIEKRGALGAFHCHIPMMSLPLAFDATPETIPPEVPYFAVPAAVREEWTTNLAGVGGCRVGLVWAGRKDFPRDDLRSIEWERLSPLLAVRGVTFVSLQKGQAPGPMAEPGRKVLDFMDDCDDLMDTAGLMTQLDLIISVDTSVAHLAGALGKPVWLLNRFESEWRWMLEREDSPWYPTMRIFRQRRSRDWDELLARVASALPVFVASSGTKESRSG